HSCAAWCTSPSLSSSMKHHTTLNLSYKALDDQDGIYNFSMPSNWPIRVRSAEVRSHYVSLHIATEQQHGTAHRRLPLRRCSTRGIRPSLSSWHLSLSRLPQAPWCGLRCVCDLS